MIYNFSSSSTTGTINQDIEPAVDTKGKEAKQQAIRVVLCNGRQTSDNIDNAIILISANEEFYVMKVGGSKRLMKLSLTKEDKEFLLTQLNSHAQTPFIEINNVALTSKIVSQYTDSAVHYAISTATFWQKNEKPRFSSSSAQDNRIVEIDSTPPKESKKDR